MMLVNTVMRSTVFLRSSCFAFVFYIFVLLANKPVESYNKYTSLNDEINEIAAREAEWMKPIPKDDHLPRCIAQSICATLQANARGVQITSLCGCRWPLRCPVQWDTFDGHSVTQGSDQYKFCEPINELPACASGDVAYISTMGSSKSTRKIVTSSDKVYCKCGEMDRYVPGKSFSEVDGEIDIFKATYKCEPMAECSLTEACKVITESPESFLVNPKCICPRNLYCPTVNSKKVEGKVMGKGRMDFIYCQSIN